MKNKLVVFAGLVLLVFSIAVNARADIVHEDDVIITNTGTSNNGSLCVGLYCIVGESFGFDTIRLKTGNCRIHFEDTTSSTTFPTRDWRITINDSTSGGGDRFSIDDIDGGTTPFTIEGSAPDNSLYVDDEGNIGLGTSTPQKQVHITSGNTPTIRFEQDGSISGFDPQTWDVAGNEANFFIRDVTNSNAVPFKIKPGAPTSSIYIAASGRIGLGASSPSAPLHVGSGVPEGTGNSMVLIQRSGDLAFQLDNTDVTGFWNFSNALNESEFRISRSGTGQKEMVLTENGDLTITGTLITSGSCSAGCDAVFRKPIESIDEHASSMWENSYLPAVGQTLENSPFNVSEKTLGMLNELEKAHIYIEQLHNRAKTSETERLTLADQLKALKTVQLTLAESNKASETARLALAENIEVLKTENKKKIENLKAENKQLRKTLTSVLDRQSALEDMVLALSTNQTKEKLVKYDGPGLDELQSNIQ